MQFYLHPPGNLSKGTVLDVGLKCVHSCKFCYYSFLDGTDDQFRGMRRASFRSREDCFRILELLQEQGFLHFDVTGGEPTLHPNLIEIIRHGRGLGLSSRIITLGQFLTRRMKGGTHDTLIEDLIEAGVTNFLFSMHAVEEDLFKSITGGSYAKLAAAMDYLDGLGDFDYTSNTTVFEENFRTLPQIAREVCKHNIYLHNFIIMNAYYEWNLKNRVFGVQPRFSDVDPYLREAVEILESNGVGVNIRYSPLCALPGLERNIVGLVGVRYDPYEWMNLAGHHGGDPEYCAKPYGIVEGDVDRDQQFLRTLPIKSKYRLGQGNLVYAKRGPKVFPKSCMSCRSITGCDGIDPKYIRQYGSQELQPSEIPPSKPPLMGARTDYLAPFFLKLHQRAPVRERVRRHFFPRRVQAAPLVTVVITRRSGTQALPKAIDSVLSQSYSPIELIVVDGTGSDQLPAAAQVLPDDSRISSRFVPAESENPAACRNQGIEQGHGEFVVCLDADVQLDRSFLEACMAVFRADPGVSIVYPDGVPLDQPTGRIPSGEYDLASLIYDNPVPDCALFRRAAWDDVGGYRENTGPLCAWDFWIAAGARGHTGKRLPRPLFHHRVDSQRRPERIGTDAGELENRIVLNNPEVYPRPIVRNARENLRAMTFTKEITRQSARVRPADHKRAWRSIRNVVYRGIARVV